jgi:hypothetical protein
MSSLFHKNIGYSRLLMILRVSIEVHILLIYERLYENKDFFLLFEYSQVIRNLFESYFFVK